MGSAAMLIKRIFLPFVVNINTKLRQLYGKKFPLSKIKRSIFFILKICKA
jgi:hypothetical protein